MEKLTHYRQLVQQILTEHNQHKSAYGDVEQYTLFDEKDDHYLLLSSGWYQYRRIYGCLIHIDLKDNKIWIQYDGTEVGVANELVSLGVPKQDIVLAFQAPYARKYTEFAVGE
ncbi:MAG: XisI protein [Symploca sp. SIO1B1]|nr:XisI protein [Symploca sp. SIO2G7]NER19328.1 XisI protein [Symploca sp. SIO1C2]NER49715.1 XisI protein [Symploca sp. SIO1A3]NER92662.1 XisI protein [Symploca sp. SIO1B1]